MKTTMKRRIVSIMLALTMVLGILPANLIPQASAVQSVEGHTLVINPNGTFRLTLNLSGASGEMSNWAVAIIPDVSGDSSAYAPSRRIGTTFTDGLGTVSNFNSRFDAIMAPSPSNYYTKNSSDGTRVSWENGVMTFTGSLGTTMANAVANETGKYKADGTTVGSGDTSIPMIAIYWSSTGQNRLCVAKGNWTGKLPVDITAKDYTHIGTGTNLAKDAKLAATEAAAPGTVRNDGAAAEFDGITFDLKGASGTSLNGSFAGATLYTDQALTDPLSRGDNIESNTTYYIGFTVGTTAIAAANIPVTGTATIAYYDENAVRQTITVNVQMVVRYPYIVGSEGSVSFQKGMRTTTAVYNYPTLTVGNATNTLGPVANTTGATDAAGYIKQTSPLSTLEGTSRNEDLTAELIKDGSQLMFELQSAADTLEPGTYKVTLPFVFRYKAAATAQIFQSRTVEIPITIYVDEAPIVETRITFDPNGGTIAGEAAGASKTIVTTTGKVTAPSVSRTSYTFVGWKSSADGKTYTEAEVNGINHGADTTYTAQWSENTYDVTVDLKKDGQNYASSGLNVWLSKDGSTYSGGTAANATTGSVTIANQTNGTYTVYVSSGAGGTKVDTGVTVTVNNATPSAATVDYYTVTTALGTGAQSATVSATNTVGSATSGVFLKNTTAYLSANPDATYAGDTATWTTAAPASGDKAGTVSTAPSGKTNGPVGMTVTGTTVATATYSSLADWSANITVRVDGTATTSASYITDVFIQAADSTTLNAKASGSTFAATVSGGNTSKTYTKVIVKTVSNTVGYEFDLSSPITVSNKTATVDLYSVAVKAEPAAGGSATVAGRALAVAPAGTSLQLGATANTNYTFGNWTSSKGSDNGISNTTTAGATYTVATQSAQTTLTANFVAHPVLEVTGGTVQVEVNYPTTTLDVTATNSGPGDAKQMVYFVSASPTERIPSDVFTVDPESGTLAAGGSATLTLTAGRKGKGTYKAYIWAYETTDGTNIDSNVKPAVAEVILDVKPGGTPTAVVANFTWDVYLQQLTAPTAQSGKNTFSTAINLTSTFNNYVAAEVTFRGDTLKAGTDYTLTNNNNGTATFTVPSSFLGTRTMDDNRGVFKITFTNQYDVVGETEVRMDVVDSMPSVTGVSLGKTNYTVGDTITVSAITTSNSSLTTPPANSSGVVEYKWYKNGTLIATSTTNNLAATAAASFQTGDMVTVEVWGKAAVWSGATAGATKPSTNHVYKATSYATASVVLQAPTYTVTLMANAMGTITGNYNGGDTSSSTTGDNTITVTENGSVALTAKPLKGYKFTGWSSDPAAETTGTANRFVTTTAASTSYGGVTRNVSISAAFKAVTDLKETPASISLNSNVGYTTSPNGTITITNEGRKTAAVTVATSDPTSSFTFSTLPTTVAGYNGTANGTSTITITPKPGLPAGTYSATVTITETGDADDTMSGTLQSWTIPVTFTVVGSNAAVNVKLDNSFCNDELVMLRPTTGADVMMVKPASGNNYTAVGLAPSVVYTLYVNGVNTGKTVTGVSSENPTPVEAQFWTLTLDAKAGSTAMVTMPTASGGTKTTLKDGGDLKEGYLDGTTVSVSAPAANTDAAGLNYQFTSWSNATGSNTAGTTSMTAAKTVTANYGQTNGIKYYWNDGTTTDPYYTDNNGYASTATGITLIPGPARAGYRFDGWVTTPTGTSVINSPAAASALGTPSGGYYSLYAKWTQITTTITWTPTAPNGTYGVDYFAALGTAKAVDSNNTSYPVTYAIQDTDTLAAAGLTLNSDGTITGKPYQTYLGASELTFTVRASAVTPSGTVTKDVTLSINIGKYTPALNVTGITGVTATDYSSAVVKGTVTAPWYNGSAWVTMNDTYPTASDGNRDPNSGTVAVTAATPGSLSRDCTVKYTPSTSVATGLTGGQVFDSVYNPVETTFTVSMGAATYTLTVNPNPKDFGTYTKNDPALSSLSQAFDVTRTGNQTIHVDYELVTASGSPDTSNRFTLTKASGTRHELNETTQKKTGAFTVAPGASIIGTPGSYVTYVKVSAYAAATGGDPEYSILVPVMIEIKNPDNFEATVKVYENSTASARTPKNIVDIQLVSLADGDILVPDSKSPATAGTYTWTGAGNKPVYGEPYKVQVKYDSSWTDFVDVPDVVVKFDDASKDVNFYELKLTHTPASDISPDKKLDGSTTLSKYLLKGQTAQVETTAVDQYTFNGWLDGSTTMSTGLLYPHTMEAKATTLVASYTRVGDKYNVTYSAGSFGGVTAPASVAVPVDSKSPYDSGATVTVLNMAGVWPGYTFKNWEIDGSAVGNSFVINKDTTLVAVWEKAPAGTWSTVPGGTYGSSYSGSVSLSNAAALGVNKYEVTSGSLPGGLTMGEDGRITGTPNASEGDYTFTVTASNTGDDNLTWTKEYTIHIDKAQPVITKATVSNVQVGAALSTATITASVSAPYWDVSGSSWEQKTWNMTVGVTGTPDIGDLTATMTSGGAFQVSGNDIKLTYTPDSATNTGLTGQVYNDIYKTAEFETTVSAGEATYDIKVDPSVIKFTVTRGQNNYNPSTAQDITVANNGNQDAYVTYTLTGETDKFDVTKTGTTQTIAATTSTTKNTDIFTAMANYNAAVGTYTAQVRVDNYASAADAGAGTNVKATQYVTLILEVVEQESFEATVNVYETQVGGSRSAKSIAAVRLLPVGNTGDTGAVALTEGTTGKYSATDAVYGTAYKIQVQYASGDGWTDVPGKTVRADAATQDVDYYQIKLTQLPAGAGAILTLNSTVGSAGADVTGTFLSGTTITAETSVPGTHRFVNWTEGGQTTTHISHAVAGAVTLTANFEEIVVYTVKFDPNGGTLTVSGGTATTTAVGGTDVEKMITSGKNGFNTGDTIGVHTVGTDSYNIVWADHTFRGWALADGKDGASGSYGFTANGENDVKDNATADRIIVLYAVWTKDSDIAFSDAIVKGVYKHTALTQTGGTATGGTGTYGSYELVAGYTVPFGIGNGPLTSGPEFTGAASGAPNDTGSESVRITVTDSANATATATYTFIIDKANVQPQGNLPGTTGGTEVKVSVGDSAAVKAAIEGKFTSTTAPMDGIDTGETNVNGSWTVVGSVPTTPGKHAVTVKFTPENKSTVSTLADKYGDHYNEYTTTVEVEVTAKLITGAGLAVTEPSTGDAPMNLAGLVAAANTLTSADSGATYVSGSTGDVEIVGMSWTPAHDPFQANIAYTVTVTLHVKEGSPYEFDASQTGGSYNFAGQIAGQTAKVQSINKSFVTLQYTFPAEDQVVNKIWVDTSIPAAGTSSTNVDVHTPDDRVKYAVTESTWYERGTKTAVSSANPFDANKTYDLVVKVRALPGYQFDATAFNKAVGAELKTGSDWDACVNTSVTAPVAPQDAKVEIKLAQEENRDVIYIRYSSFEPIDKTVVRIELISGELDTTVYYATTTPDQTSGNTDIKAGVTDHKSGVNAVFSDANTKAPIKFRVYYTDSTGAITTDDMSYDKTYNSLVYLDGGRNYQTLANGHVFTNVKTPMDQTTFDGQNVYLAYTKDSQTYYASVPVGTLTVRELQADGITAGGKENVTLRYELTDASFKATTGSMTAAVTFNSNAAGKLDNSANMSYSATKGNGSGNWFFEVGDADAPTLALHGANWTESGALTQLTVGADVKNYNGKTVYMSYLDVNNNIVRTPLGIIRLGSEVSVDVTDENGHDPEYGDKLTATPGPKDPGDYTYQWQVKDGSDWKDIPGEVGRDYVPTGDKIGETVRVVVTDKETGTTADGDTINGKPIVIQKRSVKFVVAPHDKIEDGNAQNNSKAYATGDFTLTVADGFGGVLPVDQSKVTLNLKSTLNTDANRPPYSGSAAGDKITWPAITVNDSSVTTGASGGYEFGGASGGYYRLTDQTEQENRGTILAKDKTSVTHVDVSFAGVPVYSETIPTKPMGVTDNRETYNGDSTDEAAKNTYTAHWYTDFNETTLTGTPVTESTFQADKAYTVVVKVRPNTAGNYIYDENTRFNFHFGADDLRDVTSTTWGKNKDGIYTMYYTFPAVERIKIAHVNVSVPQPVVYGSPADGAVNQALGTNNSVRTADVEMSSITWTDASGSTPTQFVADGVYTATFTLTTKNGYKYLNKSGTPKDDSDVTFIVSGVGPIEGAASDTTGNTVIESVTTETTDADNVYKVVVVYKAIKGGKVTLTDVVVDASVPKASVEKTGPEVTGKKPYELTGGAAANKWEYWTGSAWASAGNGTGLTSDGKFLPGTDYRVTAKAVLTDTNRYQITDDTKFYLAGLECTADDAANLHGTGDKKLTKVDDNTYTLIQEFSIPSNDIEMITVTYPEPVAGQTPATKPDTYGLRSQVTINDSTGTKWSKKTSNTAPTGTADFTGSNPTGTFTDGTYYMVEATIAANDGYSFVTSNADGVGNTQVNINGVLVNVGGAMGEKKDSEGLTIGWAMAVYEDGNVKARYIAKTAAVDRIITEVTTNVTAPVAGATPATTTSTSSALNGEHRDVKSEGMTSGGDVTIAWSKANGGTAGSTFEMATAYKATFTLTTKDQYTYKDSANNDERVLFSVNGVKVTGAGTVTGGDGITVQTVKNSDTSYTVTVTFPETSDKTPIAAVTVTYDEPAIGGYPAKSINYTPAERVRLGTEADSNLLVSNKSAGTTWFKGGMDMTTITSAGMSSSTSFTPGEYTVYANFSAVGNFKFDANTTFTVNGHKYQGNDSAHVTIGQGGATAQVCHTFTVSGEIVRVATNVTQPVANGSVSNAVAKLLAQTDEGMDVKDAGITVSNAAWKVSSNGTDGWTAAGSTFEAGKYYQASFTVTANSANGYHFKTGDDVVEFLVNSVGWVKGGQSAEQSGVKVETTQNGSSDSYTVTVTFPQTGSTADVFTVWGVAEPKANSAISSAPLTVVSPAPYQVVNDGDTKWEHKTATGTWESATGSFQPGETYKATIKVEIKTENDGIYQFVNGTVKTAGYINDTTPNATKVSYTKGDGTDEHPQYVTIEREFTIEKTKEIVRVNSDAPAKGVALPTSITEGDSGKYEFISASWAGKEEGGLAVAGEKYTLTVTVKPKVGVELYGDVTGYKWGSKDADDWKANGDGTYTVTFTHDVPPDGYVSAAPAVGIVEPAKGVEWKPAVEITNVTVLETEWTEGTFDGNKFKSDETYTVKIYLADEKPDKQPLDAQVSLNGEKLNVQTDTDGRKYITKTWKTASEDNKILSVLADVIPPTANGTPSSSMIDIKRGEPYKIVSGTNKWYTDSACTQEATGKFEAGKRYWAQLTVVMPSDAKQEFTSSTNGYINNDNSTKKTWNAEDKTITLSLPFDVPKTTTPVTVGSAAPNPGNPLPTAINPGNSDKYTFEDASWGPGTEAEYSKTYTLTVTVVPKDGVELPGKDTSGYTWNGKKAESAEDVGGGKYRVTFTYSTGPEPQPAPPSSGGGTTVIETPVVTYALRDLGVTLDLTAEKVNKNSTPKKVPEVQGITGLKFVGWSETDPSTIKDGKLPTLVDPTTFKITDDKTFYAVYEKVAEAYDHSHYVIGFPNGTFGPDANITRGQVATIIARSCLENFIEGGAYGNPGNYTDVENHWASSAISYCSMNGVFSGYEDGTFRPDQYITRQELATVVARLAGVQLNEGLPFSDSGEIAAWAVNGVYTNYANGWVNGYTDGTFKPLNDISRAETVKVFNGYLGRGTDREGLSELREYVHSGVASNIEGDGKDEYMTWADVPKTHWAYYEIIEAANDHNFHWRDADKEVPPEDWDEAFIDETWRYQDDANDGADSVGRDETLPMLTVTYVVKSNGVTWDSITEEVRKFSSPDPEKLPKAEANEGYRFAGWSDVDPDTGSINLVEPDPTAFPVLEDKIFYAVFEPDVYVLPKVTVTYVIGDHGSTDMALTETLDMWQSPTVENKPEVTAHEGWRFIGWSETDPATGTVTLTDPTDHPALTDEVFYAVYEAENPAQTQEPSQPQAPVQTETPAAGVRYSYINGYDDNTFHPDDDFTRATAAAIIANLKGYDSSASYDAPEFDDLEGHWAANAIAFCVSQGLMSGYTDNTFRPDNAITRQEFAVVLARVAGETESGDLPFADTDSIASYARDSVYTAYVRGWIGGYDDGTFLPERNVTRAEAVKMFNGYLGRSADREYIDSQSGYTVFDDVEGHWAYYEIIEATNTWNQ